MGYYYYVLIVDLLQLQRFQQFVRLCQNLVLTYIEEIFIDTQNYTLDHV